ncbi:hypothetical protein MNBD_GAMMA12-3285 [hydrothermal vent metagenome]|uniref:Leucine-rich repeat containing protein n=1 Tax=hydrothermal vent metagenome TaxID=652676 RepID=A0A3B0YFQ7_9ZZZZ
MKSLIETKFHEDIINDIFDPDTLMAYSGILKQQNDPRAEIIEIEIELQSDKPKDTKYLFAPKHQLVNEVIEKYYIWLQDNFGDMHIEWRCWFILDLEITSSDFDSVKKLLFSGELKFLRSLEIEYDENEQLPRWLEELTHIKELELSNNHLNAVPDFVRCLAQLTRLDLHSNEITNIPDWICELKHLTYINLDYNRLVQLPESIGKLLDLKTILVASNRLSHIPKSIAQLNLSHESDFSLNYISKLHETVNLRNIEIGPQKFRFIRPLMTLCYLVIVLVAAKVLYASTFYIRKPGIVPEGDDYSGPWIVAFIVYVTLVGKFTSRIISQFKYRKIEKLSYPTIITIIVIVMTLLLIFTDITFYKLILDYYQCEILNNECQVSSIKYRPYLLFIALMTYFPLCTIHLYHIVKSKHELKVSSILGLFYSFIALTTLPAFIMVLQFPSEFVSTIFMPMLAFWIYYISVGGVKDAISR